MYTSYDTCPYTHHYQSGGSLPYFAGYPQYGHGIGSLFGSLARTALPLLKRNAGFIGKQVLNAACDVGNDVLDGHTVKSSINKRVFGEQGGSGHIKRKKKKCCTSVKKTPKRKVVRKRKVVKKKKKDIFA
jgi:hypothetical protein